MESAIGVQVCNKAGVLMLFIDSGFKKYFHLGRRRPAVIWSVSSDVQPVSTRM